MQTVADIGPLNIDSRSLAGWPSFSSDCCPVVVRPVLPSHYCPLIRETGLLPLAPGLAKAGSAGAHGGSEGDRKLLCSFLSTLLGLVSSAVAMWRRAPLIAVGYFVGSMYIYILCEERQSQSFL